MHPVPSPRGQNGEQQIKRLSARSGFEPQIDTAVAVALEEELGDQDERCGTLP